MYQIPLKQRRKRMNRSKIIIILVAFIAILFTMLSVETVCFPADDFLEIDIDRLKSNNKKDRENVAESIRIQRKRLIEQLIELASQKVNSSPAKTSQDIDYISHHCKQLSLQLLGDLRASESVTVLLHNLEYQNPNVVLISYYVGEGHQYTSAQALSKIGMPAVSPVVDKLGKYSEKEKGHSICCWIIREILGPRLGKIRLEMAIEETKDETVKKNLTAALPNFKTEKEKADEERARREKAGKQGPLLKN